MDVGVHEAKTTLSKLLRRVAGGEEITITHRGEPLAKLVPFDRRRERELGQDEGRWSVPDDFDEPLPDEILAEFE